MKKVSAIVLAVLMLMMVAVPFASAEDASAEMKVVVETVEGAKGEEVEVPVSFSHDAKYGLINGTLKVEYDADALELVVPVNKRGNEDLTMIMNSEVITLTVEAMQPEAGVIDFALAGTAGIMDFEGVMMTLKFKVLTDVAGTYEVKVTGGDDLSLEDVDTATATAAGEVVKAVVVGGVGGVKVVEATQAPTTEAPTTAAPTAAPTEAPATTTIPDTATGETTPWALLTVTALAGAALVGLTMKRK